MNQVRRFLSVVVFSGCAVWAGRAAEAADPAAAAETYRVQDTLAPPREAAPDARSCLQQLTYQPGEFEVTCTTEADAAYDQLVRFPSPIPSGDPANDRVAMEWYMARTEDGTARQAPAVLVVHESGRAMPVGRLFARGLQAAGFHAFLIHLPYYGKRRSDDREPDSSQIFTLVRQAIADVRRARDAVAVLPGVEKRHVALQGTSLGGFVVATSAALDYSFQAVFVMLAGGNLYDMIMRGQRDTAKVRAELQRVGLTGDELRRLLWQIEPTRVAHRLDPDRTWLYSGEQDQVVPLENAVALAKAAHLDAQHHIRIAANHYTAIVYFPVILQHVSDHIRSLAEVDTATD
jgi:dienelactone hydrolase